MSFERSGGGLRLLALAQLILFSDRGGDFLLKRRRRRGRNFHQTGNFWQRSALRPRVGLEFCLLGCALQVQRKWVAPYFNLESNAAHGKKDSEKYRFLRVAGPLPNRKQNRHTCVQVCVKCDQPEHESYTNLKFQVGRTFLGQVGWKVNIGLLAPRYKTRIQVKRWGTWLATSFFGAGVLRPRRR